MWRGLLPPLLPQEIHLFTPVQEGEEEVWGLPVSLPATASLPVHGRHHHHLPYGLSQHLQLYINMNSKGWDVLDQLLTTTALSRAELVMCSHVWALARLLGLGPITFNPHTLVAANTSLPPDFGQEIFWSLLIKPSEGNRTTLSWSRASIGMTLQSLQPWFTISLSQSETILSPRDVVLPTPCPGCMFLLAPLCQRNS